MDGLHVIFDELVDALKGVGPTPTATATEADLARLSLAHRRFLEGYMKIRNPDAVIQGMAGTVEGVVISSNKTAGRSGLGAYLAHYEPVPLLGPFFTPPSKFEDGEVLHSYHIPTLTEQQKKFVFAHLAEGKSGTPMRLYNMVPAVMLALGPKASSEHSKVCFGMLRTFSTLWGEEGGDECDDPPYAPIRVTVDSMSPKKIYTALNLAYHMSNFEEDINPYLNRSGIDTVLMCKEVLSGMCPSPLGFALNLKGALGFMYLHTGAIATPGTYLTVPNADEWDTYST